MDFQFHTSPVATGTYNDVGVEFFTLEDTSASSSALYFTFEISIYPGAIPNRSQMYRVDFKKTVNATAHPYIRLDATVTASAQIYFLYFDTDDGAIIAKDSVFANSKVIDNDEYWSMYFDIDLDFSELEWNILMGHVGGSSNNSYQFSFDMTTFQIVPKNSVPTPVYGVLTESSGTYTLTLQYRQEDGTAVNYTSPSSQTLNVYFGVRSDSLPSDRAIVEHLSSI